MKTAANPEACNMLTPLEPIPQIFHSLCNKPTPSALPPTNLNLIPGRREKAIIMFCFCLLEIINPEISFARVFLLSAVFCFTCFLSQTETQATMFGLHPDPLLLGANQKTGRLGSLTYMVTSPSPTSKNIFLKCLPLQHLGAPLYNSVNNEH